MKGPWAMKCHYHSIHKVYRIYSHIIAYALLTIVFVSIHQVSISHAQITSDTTPSTTLGTIVTPGGTTLNVTGGTRPDDGRNLFHSFENFSINADQIANFLNDHNLPTKNIFSRVTGGNPSNILGMIKTTDAIQGFGDANFYLMNPQGIIFGPNAQLNVGGSFYATTANNIELTDGQLFEALPAENDALLLTTAAPEAFGFLGENTSGITINQSTLKVEVDNTLSIVGGDIQVEGGSLIAPSGQVVLVAVGKQNQVMLDQAPTIQTDVTQLGEMTISQGALIDTSGAGSGTIVIRGSNLTIDGTILLANSTEQGEVNSGGSTETGINGEANSVFIQNGSLLATEAFGDSRGANINFKAREILEVQGSFIGTQANGSEKSGDIILKVEKDLKVLNSSLVLTIAANGEGNAGNIEVNADKVLLSGPAGTLTGLTSQTNPGAAPTNPSPSTGNAGSIRVIANRLEMFNGFISTPGQPFSTGNAGDIEVTITGGEIFASGANGGIFTNTFSDGKGGNLLISANDVTLMSGASLQAGTAGTGNAAEATITLTGDLNVGPGSFIQTRAESSGNAGPLNITAKNIVVTGVSDATAPQSSPQLTGFSTTTNDGQGGDLTIIAENFRVTDKGFISGGTSGTGNAGNISINLTESLFIANGGQIISNTNDDGNAGSISIRASDITLTGVNPVPFPRFDGSIEPARSAISSQSQGVDKEGNAGDIHVIAKNFSLLDGATIDSQSFGNANAGNIDLINMETILLDNGTVATQAENAFGGNITLKASNLIYLIGSEITSLVREGSGNAGNINLDPEFVVVQGSRIDSSTTGLGDGGDIRILASSAVLVDPFSSLDASSQFGGSGTVNIRAPIQNLGETIAPLPEEILKISGLFAARCAAQKDGKFSSFAQSTSDSFPQQPGKFLPSPLLPHNSLNEKLTNQNFFFHMGRGIAINNFALRCISL
ncbi:MAG: hypothetical protein NPIRA01_16720 [Nitrospirales bacterium]|nr:MAG: hypothetical protein NPIRA01_16720 [Nitrospirales bacterium]